MASYQYRKSHYGDKTVVRSSYLRNGISYTSKMPSLYWISPQKTLFKVRQCKQYNISSHLKWVLVADMSTGHIYFIKSLVRMILFHFHYINFLKYPWGSLSVPRVFLYHNCPRLHCGLRRALRNALRNILHIHRLWFIIYSRDRTI